VNVAHRRSTVSDVQETNETGHMEILKANYDLVVTAFTAGVLLLIGAPLPLWALWAAVAPCFRYTPAWVEGDVH
jgi:hypothetical protein